MINVDYPNLLELFPDHLAPKRTESAAFLIWYLQHYYRLDATEAVDAVCDKGGDKGVDGIFVNDNDQTITIFQSKISQKSNSTVGDASLRDFAGTLAQFASPEAVNNLLAGAGDAEVAKLIRRADVITKLATHEVRGEFLTNIDTDRNGENFLTGHPQITFVGKTALVTTFISDERNKPIHDPATFDVFGLSVSEYIVDANRRAVIAPVKATELVKLQGIADQSIFIHNVRGPLGRTKVNKDIVASLKDHAKHKLFPLFHNGITVIAGSLDVDQKEITVTDYYVVNGCQSLSALYSNKDTLTDDLRVLAKFIKTDPRSAEAGLITAYSNNQNGVRPRDFKANTQMQIRLQNEFRKLYDGEYAYEIKRGEYPGPGEIIKNEDAGLYLMAFDLKEPWATHRKYEVFEDKHSDIFGRPEVTADRIVLCEVIIEAIKARLPKIENQMFARYVLTRFALLYVVREILEKDALWGTISQHPAKFVRNEADRTHFRNTIGTIMDDMVINLNAELKDLGDDFDYRGNLRDQVWVKKISNTLVADHLKLIGRGFFKSFKDEWEARNQNAQAAAE